MVPDVWLSTVVNVSDASLGLLVALSVFSVYYYSKNQSEEKPSLYSSLKQCPDDVKDRIRLVGKHYLASISILVICASVACLSTNVQNFIKSHYILTTISTTLGLFLSMLFVNNFSYTDNYYEKLFFFIMHCILTTPTICTLGAEICFKATLSTLILIAVLTSVALTADQDFHLALVNPLTKVNGVVVAASIFVTLIGTPKNSMEILILCLNVHLGFFFFAGMFIVNIQLLLTDCQTQDERFDPIYIAAVMEISTLNLFLRMATLITLKLALRKL